jgi:glycosyltransferase involved in cell wall biosynthesis
MPTGPRVSVCIRAHAREEELRVAIRGVLAQTYGDFELVVSDDGGRLRGVVESFGDSRIHYHRNTRSLGPALNLVNAVRLARGQLIAILNDDDRWLPGYLAAVVDAFDRDPDLGVVFTDDWLEIGTRRVRRRLPYVAGRHDRFLCELLEHSLPASGVVMKRTVWQEGEQRAPVSPSMVGDAVVWLRSAAAGWPFYYVDEPLAVSRVHVGQISWSDARLPSLLVATYDAFRFDDPHAERLRRARVSEFLLARAHAHLLRRRAPEAWRDIARAHRIAPRPLGLRAALALSGARGAVMRWGASRPLVLMTVLELWRRFRPPVLPRRRPPSRAAFGPRSAGVALRSERNRSLAASR